MASTALKLTLDSTRAAKLRQLARQAEVDADEFANSVLASFIDEVDQEADPAAVTAILDSIPGALERAQLGARQIETGEYVDLDRL